MHRSSTFLLLVTLAAGCEQADPQVGQRAPAILAGKDAPRSAPGEAAPLAIAKEFTNQELDRIEGELKVKLPKTYRQFMLARSKELLGYTYPLRGQTELWFDSELFGFDVDRLISENTGQRGPDMAAGDAFPGWWKEYFFFGTNGGGDYYALRLDGAPGVWFIDCDDGTIKRYADSLDDYVQKSLSGYEEELETYRQLEDLYQRKERGEVREDEFDRQWQEIIEASLSN